MCNLEFDKETSVSIEWPHLVPHYRTSMMQSRFVPFNENFVIRRNCITKICSLRYPVFSTFSIPSAWSSCDVLYVSMHHIWRKCIKKLCCPPAVFECLAGMCEGGVLGIVPPTLPSGPDILLLPILPRMVEASLEDLALGLPKLSALGLPMLHLHRFGHLCRQQQRLRLSSPQFPTCN